MCLVLKAVFVCFFTNPWSLSFLSCSVLSAHDPKILEFRKEPYCTECLPCRGDAGRLRHSHGVCVSTELCVTLGISSS